MKKLLLIAVLCLPALAEKANFGTLTATGTTTAAQFETTNHTVQAVVTGSPSGCTLRLEISLDGTHWYDASGTQSCNSTDAGTGQAGVTFHVDGKAASYVRVNLLTLSGGSTPAVTVTYRGTN